MKKYVFIMMPFLFTTFFIPNSVMAVCVIRSGVVQDTTLDFGTIVANNDDPIGTVLATATVPATSNSFLSCSGTNAMNMSTMMNETEFPATNDNTIGKTNLDGVGIRAEVPGFTRNYTPPSTTQYILWKNGVFNQIAGNPGNGTTTTGISSFKVELIKTGPITGGTLSAANRLLTVFHGNPYGALQFVRVFLGSGQVIASACEVKSSVINVAMGDVMDSDFSGAGSTLAEKQFDVPIECKVSQQVSVNVSPGAAGSYTGANGVINLDDSESASTAQNVGLQILYGGTPVIFNTDISVGTADIGTFTIPFTARYYQKTGTVSSGTANASATMTMTYK